MSVTELTTIDLGEIPLSVLQEPDSQPPSPEPDDEVPPEDSRIFDAAESTTLAPRSRLLITSLVVTANLMQFVVNFVTLGGGLAFSKGLGHEVGPGQSNWMAASYSLTQGACVLVSGRLGAVFGHQRMLLLGNGILAAFTLITGFCRSYNTFVANRALSGVGGGLLMPNAVAIITTMVPPGRSRNILMGLFATSAPVGGVLGGLLVGLFTEPDMNFVGDIGLFVLLAGLCAILTISLYCLLPPEQPVDRGGNIDYFGAALGLSSLLLFGIVWNQAPSVGWAAPSEIVCLILSVILFLTFLVWEKKFTKSPIMPLSIFKAPTFTALVFVVLLSYMSFAISLWYSIAWQQILRDLTVLDTGINFIPFGISSSCAIFIAAWLIPRLAAQWIMAIGVATALGGNLLLALMPVQQTYWAQLFAAMTLGGFCPDFVYVAAQVIASNSVSRRQQGVASSLIGTLNLYGNSLGLGLAGTIETEVVKYGADTVSGYRAALYFGVALAVLGLVLDFAFVRMPKDEREGWDESIENDDGPELGVVLGGASTAVDGRSAV